MATKEERNTFSIMIEDLVEKLNVSYMEAIITYCEDNNLEPEIAGTLVNDVLRSKVETEAQNLRYLPKGSCLPL